MSSDASAPAATAPAAPAASAPAAAAPAPAAAAPKAHPKHPKAPKAPHDPSKKLTTKELKACRRMTKGHATTFPLEIVKQIAEKFREKVPSGEIKNADVLKQLLHDLGYFELQLKTIAGLVESEKTDVVALTKSFVESEAWQRSQTEALFKEFDRDHSGSISLREFLSGYVITLAGDQHEKAGVIFDLWDTDKSRTLTHDEVRNGWITAYEQQIQAGNVGYALGLTVGSIDALLPVVFEENWPAVHETLKDSYPRMLQLYLEQSIKLRQPLVESVKKEANQIVDMIFQLADKNNDKVLTRAEYVDAMGTPEISSAVDQKAESLFVDPEIEDEMLTQVVVAWLKEVAPSD